MERDLWLRILIILLVAISALFLASQLVSLVSYVSDILLVLFLAWLLAFVLKPLAALITRWGMPRVGSVAIVYLALLVAICTAGIIVVPMLVAQVAQIGQQMLVIAEQVPGWFAPLQDTLNDWQISIDLYALYRAQDISTQVRDLGTSLAQNAINFATGLASATVNTILILVISFYMMLDGGRIIGALLDVVPDRWQDESRFLLNSIDHRFGGFLRGQLVQAVVYGGGTAIVMAIAGLQYTEVASLLAGIAMFIPFFGPILGIIPPTVIALLSVPFPTFILVLLALLVLQQLVLNVLAPKVMADAVGMHPILVFVALLLGIKVAGPLGAVFGVPVLAVINSMAVLFYSRSKSVQRRRRVRLGLEVAGAVPEGIEADAPEEQQARPVSGYIRNRLVEQGARLGALTRRLKIRHNGGAK